MVSNKFYLLLDLNQWLLPYESNTLTAELSRSFIRSMRTKGTTPSMDYKYHITYKQYPLKRIKDLWYMDLVISLLTRNYLHDTICITSKAIRAIAQLVEHLVYTRANVFQGNSSYNQINKLWFKFMSYPINFKTLI